MARKRKQLLVIGVDGVHLIAEDDVGKIVDVRPPPRREETPLQRIERHVGKLRALVDEAESPDPNDLQKLMRLERQLAALQTVERLNALTRSPTGEVCPVPDAPASRSSKKSVKATPASTRSRRRSS